MKMECREGEDTRMVVEGYACTFGQAYDLYDSADYKITEQIDARAFDGCDMSDVIMQYDHEGRVFARNRNNYAVFDGGQRRPQDHGGTGRH